MNTVQFMGPRGVMFFPDLGMFSHEPAEGARIIAALDAVKAGRFDSFFAMCNDAILRQDGRVLDLALYIIPYALPRSMLASIKPDLTVLTEVGRDVFGRFCNSLARSRLLDQQMRAVDFFIESGPRSDIADFAFELSVSLEETPGPILWSPVSEPDDESTDAAAEDDLKPYRDLIYARVHELGGAFADFSGAPFLHGKPFSLSDTCLTLLAEAPHLSNNGVTSAKRCLIEAYTGFDLSGFYKEGMLNRQGAGVALEALFDTVDVYKFVPGRRYFFGHEMPP